MQNVITITAPKIKTNYRDGGKHGAFEDTCSAPHFMDIRTLMHFTWVKSYPPLPPALSEDKSVPKAPTQLWASFAQLNLQQKVFLTFPSFLTLFYWIIWLWAWGMNCRHRVTQSLSPWRNSTGSLKWGADLGYFTLFFFLLQATTTETSSKIVLNSPRDLEFSPAWVLFELHERNILNKKVCGGVQQ